MNSAGLRNRIPNQVHDSVQDRNSKAAEHLQLLQALSAELERAMQAIAHNELSELEDSIASQELLTARLSRLANDLSAAPGADPDPGLAPTSVDDGLITQIHAASGTLKKLNLRYSILLQHSTRSVALMTSLFSSLRGQIKEASGPRLKQQTWSCQM